MKPVKAINHIGIAVRSIDAQRPFYEGTLGAVFEGVEEVPDQKVRVGVLPDRRRPARTAGADRPVQHRRGVPREAGRGAAPRRLHRRRTSRPGSPS